MKSTGPICMSYFSTYRQRVWFLSVAPSKVRCIFCSVVDKPLLDGKYLHWASANTHYSNMDSESTHLILLSFKKGHQKFSKYFLEIFKVFGIPSTLSCQYQGKKGWRENSRVFYQVREFLSPCLKSVKSQGILS